jgi:hypothetical protein
MQISDLPAERRFVFARAYHQGMDLGRAEFYRGEEILDSLSLYEAPNVADRERRQIKTFTALPAIQ